MRVRETTAFGFALAALLLLAVSFAVRTAYAFSSSELPAEARDVLARIEHGGPFRYDRDGAVFGNYERLLPLRARGYYREYTVETPGARHRGARRLVVGCERKTGRGQAAASIDGAFAGFRDCAGPAEVYYTEDHYRSFRKVSP